MTTMLGSPTHSPTRSPTHRATRPASQHAAAPLESATLRTRDGHRVTYAVAGARDGVPV
ncbi:hypothetical protein GXB81_28815, partial [Paraburkholderia sp. Ac-20336]|nr:hypothetical protein [Paraburkholderia sp. Ac-20336]